MLPVDLVRARVRGPTIRPVRPDLDDPEVEGLADAVHRTFGDAARARARLGEVLAEVEDIVSDAADPKLGRGLARIAQDRCETETGASDDPAALRLAVFRRAAERAPLGLTRIEGLDRAVAADVLAEIGAERGLAPEGVADELYADLPSERRVVEYRVPDAAWLVRRYDLALVQALLLSATKLEVVLEEPTTPRVRQLLRWVKFHQLLHRARLGDGRLELQLDGPMSLFGASTRYGLSLASFFPALVLQDAPWTLTATVLWTRARHAKQLVVSRSDGYRSHYRDDGAYHTRTQQHFVARFAEAARGWTLTENVVPFTVSDRDLLFPDFVLARNAGADERVHLEIVGFWRPETLERRLAALAAAPEYPMILAVSRKLTGAKGGELPEHPWIVPYTDALSVEKVVRAAEARLAEPRSPNDE